MLHWGCKDRASWLRVDLDPQNEDIEGIAGAVYLPAESECRTIYSDHGWCYTTCVALDLIRQCWQEVVTLNHLALTPRLAPSTLTTGALCPDPHTNDLQWLAMTGCPQPLLASLSLVLTGIGVNRVVCRCSRQPYETRLQHDCPGLDVCARCKEASAGTWPLHAGVGLPSQGQCRHNCVSPHTMCPQSVNTVVCDDAITS